jgi:hypothetical protein
LQKILRGFLDEVLVEIVLLFAILKIVTYCRLLAVLQLDLIYAVF